MITSIAQTPDQTAKVPILGDPASLKVRSVALTTSELMQKVLTMSLLILLTPIFRTKLQLPSLVFTIEVEHL